jgi:hypothetical protein
MTVVDEKRHAPAALGCLRGVCQDGGPGAHRGAGAADVIDAGHGDAARAGKPKFESRWGRVPPHRGLAHAHVGRVEEQPPAQSYTAPTGCSASLVRTGPVSADAAPSQLPLEGRPEREVGMGHTPAELVDVVEQEDQARHVPQDTAAPYEPLGNARELSARRHGFGRRGARRGQ